MQWHRRAQKLRLPYLPYIIRKCIDQISADGEARHGVGLTRGERGDLDLRPAGRTRVQTGRAALDRDGESVGVRQVSALIRFSRTVPRRTTVDRFRPVAARYKWVTLRNYFSEWCMGAFDPLLPVSMDAGNARL